ADVDVIERDPKKPYHHGGLREQLLLVVRGLVEEFGPDGFSVAEAARRAGVSSAAPYKHFRDRTELLNGVVSDAMDRHKADMLRRRDAHPVGSLEAVTALGEAYVDFARAEPGVFRLMFGLTEGHDEDPALRRKGESCFGVVVEAVAAYLGGCDEATARRKAYLLWTIVHGHSFLSIDDKRKTAVDETPDWDLLMEAGRGILQRG
ncbi:MAG: TetR/AcrR family transcriptional regulator, partial [Pseudomonadota bacterium]